MFKPLRNLTENTENQTQEEHNYDVKQFLKHPFIYQWLLKSKWLSYYLQYTTGQRFVNGAIFPVFIEI